VYLPISPISSIQMHPLDDIATSGTFLFCMTKLFCANLQSAKGADCGTWLQSTNSGRYNINHMQQFVFGACHGSGYISCFPRNTHIHSPEDDIRKYVQHFPTIAKTAWLLNTIMISFGNTPWQLSASIAVEFTSPIEPATSYVGQRHVFLRF